MDIKSKGVIGYDEVLRGLNEAVKAKGYDYVYPRDERGICFNVFEGEPDCIVGWLLVWLGVPIEWFAVDSRDIDPIRDVCTVLHMEDVAEFTPEARNLMANVQREQDGGATWGASVTRAHIGDDWYARLRLHRNVA